MISEIFWQQSLMPPIRIKCIDIVISGVCSLVGDLEYRCICKLGWEGEQCQVNKDECLPNPCQNGGECLDGVAAYECRCAAGFSGKNCETVKIATCSEHKCQFGVCEDGPGGYVCKCKDGFSGSYFCFWSFLILIEFFFGFKYSAVIEALL